jgi:hypothetical protein
LVTPSAIEKFISLFGASPSDSSEAADPFEPQAMWTRNGCGASTCSNHVERLHRELNKVLRDCESLPHRFAEVYKFLETRVRKTAWFRHQQAQRKLKEMASEEGQIALVCLCGCGWSPIYSARFGVEGFPCRHMPCSHPLTRPILQAFDQIDHENHLRIGTLQFE